MSEEHRQSTIIRLGSIIIIKSKSGGSLQGYVRTKSANTVPGLKACRRFGSPLRILELLIIKMCTSRYKSDWIAEESILEWNHDVQQLSNSSWNLIGRITTDRQAVASSERSWQIGKTDEAVFGALNNEIGKMKRVV